MAFQGMLGHLAHPVTTPVWGRDKCSLAPAICTWSGRHTHTNTREAHAGGGGTVVGMMGWTGMAYRGWTAEKNLSSVRIILNTCTLNKQITRHYTSHLS